MAHENIIDLCSYCNNLLKQCKTCYILFINFCSFLVLLFINFIVRHFTKHKGVLTFRIYTKQLRCIFFNFKILKYVKVILLLTFERYCCPGPYIYIYIYIYIYREREREREDRIINQMIKLIQKSIQKYIKKQSTSKIK
jgi:hypothetical protein